MPGDPVSSLSLTAWTELMNKALVAPKGIRAWYPSKSAAQNSRFKLYHARKMDRKINKQIYPPDHPLHGRSQFDALVMRIGKPDAVKGFPLEIIKSELADTMISLEEIT